MSQLDNREQVKAAEAASVPRAQTAVRFDVPVIVSDEKCIKHCRVCIDSCPVDCLDVNPETGKAYMRFDECWYCLACETDCPKDAIVVKIPYLVR